MAETALGTLVTVGTSLQTTLKSAITFDGAGLHSARPVRMTLHPAAAEFGIWFRRTDVTDRDPMVAPRPGPP